MIDNPLAYARRWNEINEADAQLASVLFLNLLKAVRDDLAFGRIDRKMAGAAISPLWASNIARRSSSGDLTILAIRAQDLAAGGFESTAEFNDTWHECEVIIKRLLQDPRVP